VSDQEAPTGKYAYCIIRCEEPRRFKSLGIAAVADTIVLPSAESRSLEAQDGGEDLAAVHTVNFRDMAVVVSNSPDVNFARSRRNMMAHTTVLEEVMEEFTILPVRFGMVAPGSEVIREQVLEARYEEFDDLLVEMQGRAEMGLKAVWYESSVFEEIVAEHPTIRDVRDSLMGRAAEETYFERIRLGEMIEHAMKEKRERDAEMLLAGLRPLAHKVRLNDVITDRMVLNAAFLVEESRQAEFDAEVDRLGDEVGERLILKYVGPAPPYNFVDIVIHWRQ